MIGEDRSSSSRDESWSKSDRLLRRSDFQACYRLGRKVHGRFLVLFERPRPDQPLRVGFTLTRKVGKAVMRNRLRRRLREALRRSPLRASLDGRDLVVHVKPHAPDAEPGDLVRELLRLLSRLARDAG